MKLFEVPAFFGNAITASSSMPGRAGCSLFCRHLSVRNGILASVWKDFSPSRYAKTRQIIGTRYLVCWRVSLNTSSEALVTFQSSSTGMPCKPSLCFSVTQHGEASGVKRGKWRSFLNQQTVYVWKSEIHIHNSVKPLFLSM